LKGHRGTSENNKIISTHNKMVLDDWYILSMPPELQSVSSKSSLVELFNSYKA